MPGIPAERAFVVTVGVPAEATREHCDRVLRVLGKAGYLAGPTSDEAIAHLAVHAQQTTNQETESE